MKTTQNDTDAIHMPPDLLAEARRAANEEHRPADELVSDAVRRYLRERTPPATSERPIWETITDMVKDIPDAVFDRLPKDAASQVDHYIYGLPKRD